MVDFAKSGHKLVLYLNTVLLIMNAMQLIHASQLRTIVVVNNIIFYSTSSQKLNDIVKVGKEVVQYFPIIDSYKTTILKPIISRTIKKLIIFMLHACTTLSKCN